MATGSIPSYRFAQVLQGEKLREYRHYVAQAKKLGLVNTKTPTRTASPFGLSTGPRGGKTRVVDIINKNRSRLTPYVSPEAKRLPLTSHLEFRNLPGKPRSLAQSIKDLSEHADEINALKKPGEKFAFRLGRFHSHRTYTDIRLLAEDLGESAGLQQVFHKRQVSNDIFSRLSLVRWTRGPSKWFTGPMKMTKNELAEYRKKRNREERARSRKKKK